MEYKASFDSMTKMISVLIIFLFAVIAVSSLKALSQSEGDKPTIFIQGGIVLLLTSLLIICYVYSIRDYVLQSDQLIIRRPIGEKYIPVSEIVEVRLIEKGEMNKMIRTFGNGGLFGYYGKFYNKTLGSVTLYTTQRSNRIFLRTSSGEKLILSPDDLSLVEMLRNASQRNK